MTKVYKLWKTNILQLCMKMEIVIATLEVFFALFLWTSAVAENSQVYPHDIAQVCSEAYVSEYDLRTTLFFEQETWTVLNEDARAFILEQTIIDTAHFYGVFPQIYIEVCDLQNKQADWNQDEQRIGIDRKFLSEAPVEEALYVCHEAFYQAYAEYLITVNEADELPAQYAEYLEQIDEYKSDLAARTDNSGETEMGGRLDYDAMIFALSNVEHYYSFTLPRENEPLYETQLRRLWKDMLNPYFKFDLLQELVNDMSDYYEFNISYELEIADSALSDYNDENIGDSAVLLIDGDLLSDGDPFDCLKIIMSSIATDAIENQRNIMSEDEKDVWVYDATVIAWENLKALLDERVPE